MRLNLPQRSMTPTSAVEMVKQHGIHMGGKRCYSGFHFIVGYLLGDVAYVGLRLMTEP
jgi:hypothetical protein